MWLPTTEWTELVARAVVLYVFLLVLLRITGKRQIGQLAPFEMVLLLVLSNTIGNALNPGDSSILAAVVLATTLVGLNSVVSWATFRSKRLERWIEGEPLLIVHNGQILERNRRHSRLTHHEINAAIRQAGLTDITHVHTAVLENNGSISVAARSAHDEPAHHGILPPLRD
jgi:uncharacterized membrane protein YcaP (DUF421 family)